MGFSIQTPVRRNSKRLSTRLKISPHQFVAFVSRYNHTPLTAIRLLLWRRLVDSTTNKRAISTRGHLIERIPAGTSEWELGNSLHVSDRYLHHVSGPRDGSAGHAFLGVAGEVHRRHGYGFRAGYRRVRH